MSAVGAWIARRPSIDFHSSAFGTTDANEVEAAIMSCCRQLLAAEPESVHFYSVSHGAVAGVTFADGAQVSCKFFPGAYERLDVLTSARTVQNEMVDRGLPVARPTVGPVAWREAIVCVDEWLPSPPIADCRDPAVARVIAATLYRVIESGALLDVPALKHSRLTARNMAKGKLDGAGWITAKLRDTTEILATATGRRVVGHLDWRSQNVRVGTSGEVVAIYDWDSAVLDSEERIVGEAAAMFSVVFGEPLSFVPTPADVAQFVAEYESAAARSFAKQERQLIATAVMRKLTGQALAEQVLDPDGAKLGPLSIRSALQIYGDEYESVTMQSS